jgi:hypothetical protein
MLLYGRWNLDANIEAKFLYKFIWHDETDKLLVEVVKRK